MARLGAPRVIHEQDSNELSANRLTPVGQKAETVDGRVFRYAQAGGTALDRAKLTTNPAVDANVVNVAVAEAAAVGATEVVIDAGGTIAENAYQDGFFSINDATGEGAGHRVKGNTATTGAGEITVFLEQDNPIADTALVADTSLATLEKNPWDGVIIVPATDQADFPAGVPNIAVTASYFFWIQTGGETVVWSDETFARGAPLTFGTGVAGQVEAVDAAGELQFASAIEAASGEADYTRVFLQID